MNISLRKIKYWERLSEETPCFQAVLCLDGKPVAHVKNDGKGGCDHYDMPWNQFPGGVLKWRETLAEIEAFCSSQPPLQTQYGPLPFSLELWTGEQLNKHLNK